MVENENVDLNLAILDSSISFDSQRKEFISTATTTTESQNRNCKKRDQVVEEDGECYDDEPVCSSFSGKLASNNHLKPIETIDLCGEVLVKHPNRLLNSNKIIKIEESDDEQQHEMEISRSIQKLKDAATVIDPDGPSSSSRELVASDELKPIKIVDLACDFPMKHPKSNEMDDELKKEENDNVYEPSMSTKNLENAATVIDPLDFDMDTETFHHFDKQNSQGSSETYGKDKISSFVTSVDIAKSESIGVARIAGGSEELNQKPVKRNYSIAFDDDVISISSSQSSQDEPTNEKVITETTSANIPKFSIEKSSPFVNGHSDNNPQMSRIRTEQEVFDQFLRTAKPRTVDKKYLSDSEDDYSELGDFLDYDYQPSNNEAESDADTMENLQDSSMEEQETEDPSFEYSSSDFQEFNSCVSKLAKYTIDYNSIEKLLKSLCENFNRKYDKKVLDKMIANASDAVYKYRKEKAKKRFHSRMNNLVHVDFESLQLPQGEGPSFMQKLR